MSSEPAPSDSPRGHNPTAPRSPAATRIVGRVMALEVLDKPALALAGLIRGALGSGTVKDLLSGTQIGHALHPVLSDVPVGAWTSASLLDLMGGPDADTAAERLVAVGILAALPTAVSGFSDWADTTVDDKEVTRVGVAHAVSNVVALALYTASWAQRRGGRRAPARVLGLMGLSALGAGGFLGGHLAFNSAVAVDRTTFEDLPAEWTDAAGADDLAEGASAVAQVGGVPVLLVRRGGEVLAISDHCTHRGGPLHEGPIDGDCVTCPWHASVFSLRDGAVLSGPASAPQPALDTRIREGRIEVRAAVAIPG